MLILAVDTSGPSCGVALVEDTLLRYEATANNKLTHSVNLMPMVEEALHKGGCRLQDVDLFACVNGPGSFTGVRIGVSAIKGMAQALQKPCIGIDALEALAHGVLPQTPCIVCPIRDARVEQVYGAAFLKGERLMDDVIEKLADFIPRIRQYGEQFLFVGDGVPPYRDAIQASLGTNALFAPAHLNELKAGAAAQLALRYADKAYTHDLLVPLYLRAPQAERERKKKEASHG